MACPAYFECSCSLYPFWRVRCVQLFIRNESKGCCFRWTQFLGEGGNQNRACVELYIPHVARYVDKSIDASLALLEFAQILFLQCRSIGADVILDDLQNPCAGLFSKRRVD